MEGQVKVVNFLGKRSWLMGGASLISSGSSSRALLCSDAVQAFMLLWPCITLWKHVITDQDSTRMGPICPKSVWFNPSSVCALTHWGRVMHICVGKLTGSDNGLLPGRRQAIIWTNAGILLIGPLGTNFSEILIAIETFSFKAFENVIWKMSAILSWPQWVKYYLYYEDIMLWKCCLYYWPFVRGIIILVWFM